MTVLKCKMCGGDLQVNEKMYIGTCEYCGSTMTIPKELDEQKANLFNRANHFRRNNDFDKALNSYESILNIDNTDAEAHWGIVLCNYGIEYVEDPQTKKRIPTCHRTQFSSIYADADYKLVIENADSSAKAIYEEEAKIIDAMQKSILDISNKEEPFDVFLCYKETDANGKRTQDSVLAQEIYYELSEQGYKVFFSKITLEKQLGSAYEPYIFAALNSAKVMIVVGTKIEYFNAVWVKNEWSRYLSLIENGAKKLIIPAYRDIDPYDLPEEFAHLQSQDMSKIGFIQDLIRGVKKVLDGNEEVKTQNTNIIQTNTVAPLLERAFLCIEDSDFEKADELLEQVLNMEPKNAKAYIGKLLCELKLTSEKELGNVANSLTAYNNYTKAVRFADASYKAILDGYEQCIAKRLQVIVERLQEEEREKIYRKALDYKKKCIYSSASQSFNNIKGYKDSADLAIECQKLYEQACINEKIEFENKKIQSKKRIKKAVIIFVSAVVLLCIALARKYVLDKKIVNPIIESINSIGEVIPSKERMIICLY